MYFYLVCIFRIFISYVTSSVLCMYCTVRIIIPSNLSPCHEGKLPVGVVVLNFLSALYPGSHCLNIKCGCARRVSTELVKEKLFHFQIVHCAIILLICYRLCTIVNMNNIMALLPCYLGMYFVHSLITCILIQAAYYNCISMNIIML